MAATPVLEIGGTHASACKVDLSGDGKVCSPIEGVEFQGDPDLKQFERVVAELTQRIAPWGVERWAVAVPGPFDYQRGIGRYQGVGKFEALDGVDFRALLATFGIPHTHFLNDADAFGLGEAKFGAGKGHRAVVCLTLGTGVGSAFVKAGQCVHDGTDVPPQGYAYRIKVDGCPLEGLMSRRALIAAWRSRSGLDEDVKIIAERARTGDPAALEVFAAALTGLARGLAPYLTSFEADVLVVGGSIAKSWDLVGELLHRGLEAHNIQLPVLPAQRPDEASFLGAAWAAQSAP